MGVMRGGVFRTWYIQRSRDIIFYYYYFIFLDFIFQPFFSLFIVTHDIWILIMFVDYPFSILLLLLIFPRDSFFPSSCA